MQIPNPVFRGFSPDPSFIYAKGKYYVALSTFEWMDGVGIYCSDDLRAWRLISRPLTDDKINLLGVEASGGIWAPCLRYNAQNDLFYLVFTNMHSWSARPFKDSANYIITSYDLISWSKPVYINGDGFDPSVFFDDDGSAYYLCQEWDFRKQDKFSGILLWRLDLDALSLIGEPQRIFTGSGRGCVEGPNLYKYNGYYYLVTAEGGTAYNHAATLARSKNILGDYELHPNVYLLSSTEGSSLQKCGHASLAYVNGRWLCAHLCARPLDNGRCILGRETAFQNLRYGDDGWFYLDGGVKDNFTTLDNIKSENAEGKDAQKYNAACGEFVCGLPEKKYYDFETDDFLKDFQTLRLPYERSRFYLDGGLNVIGKDGLFSQIEQSVICRRQSAFCFTAQAEMLFAPQSFKHMAGLLYRYNEKNFFYLYSSYDEAVGGTVARVMSCVDGNVQFSDGATITDNVSFRLISDNGKATFYFSTDSETFIKIGDDYDASVLSDDYVKPMGFTGAMVGVCCQDLAARTKSALFKSFSYEETY